MMKRLIMLSLALALALQLSSAQSYRLQLEGLPYGVVSLDGSSNGNWLAIVSSVYDDDGYLKLWNLADNKAYTPLLLPQYDVTSARFVPNREAFAMLGLLSPLCVFEYRGGWSPIAEFIVGGRTMAVAPNFEAVAVADNSGRIGVLRGISMQSLTQDQGWRPQLAFAPDGSRLATAGARMGGGSVRLWNTANYSLQTELLTPFECTAVAFSPNGAYLAVGGAGGELRLYRLADYAYAEVQAHAGELTALQFTPDNTRIVSVGRDGFMRVWDVPSLALQGARTTGYPVLSLFVSPGGQFVYTGGVDGQVDRWQLATLQLEGEMTRHWRVSGFRTGTREVWVSDGAQTRVYDEQGQSVQQISLQGIFSPDKQWVITPSGVVRVSDGQVMLGGVSEGVFSPDSRYVLVQEAGLIAGYRTDTWTRLWQASHTIYFPRVRFSRNGEYFTGGEAVYATATGTRLRVYEADFVALNDDGTKAAIVHEQSPDLHIEVRRTADNTLLWQASYEAPLSHSVYDAVFAGDGRYLLVWTGEHVFSIDAATGQLVSQTRAPLLPSIPRLLLTPDTYRVLIPHDYERHSFRVLPIWRFGSDRWLYAAPAGHTITDGAFSDDGTTLLVQTQDSSVFVVAVGLTGDINGDHCVNDADLLETLFRFGQSDARADQNGDGIVDDADLLLLLFNFGNGC
ncbi:MAG: hypothetical protein KatS3mg020_0107 [Fimbriimonadales bacterium]|nr:MAG: hypothetical protein KatS3mg020_0107 [Fimbriimonadales bacterium]